MNHDQNSIWNELKSAVRQNRRYLKWVILALVVFYLSDGFYTIKTNELGVREVMGKVVDRQVLPGLHYTPPRPFSRIYKVPVLKSESLTVDDFYQTTNRNSPAFSFFKSFLVP